MEPDKDLDKVISLLFEDARNKLEMAEKESEEQLKKKKKQIVADLAKSLEDKIPIDTICIEIVNHYSANLFTNLLISF